MTSPWGSAVRARSRTRTARSSTPSTSTGRAHGPTTPVQPSSGEAHRAGGLNGVAPEGESDRDRRRGRRHPHGRGAARRRPGAVLRATATPAPRPRPVPATPPRSARPSRSRRSRASAWPIPTRPSRPGVGGPGCPRPPIMELLHARKGQARSSAVPHVHDRGGGGFRRSIRGSLGRSASTGPQLSTTAPCALSLDRGGGEPRRHGRVTARQRSGATASSWPPSTSPGSA